MKINKSRQIFMTGDMFKKNDCVRTIDRLHCPSDMTYIVGNNLRGIQKNTMSSIVKHYKVPILVAGEFLINAILSQSL